MLWIMPSETLHWEAIHESIGGHELAARILAQRGISSPEAARSFLNPEYYTPADPRELPDLAEAAERLYQAVVRGERILVWGDFDVDGQTATALLVDALRGMGGSVEYHIPNRLTHGHGVQVDVLEEKLQAGIDVILTCDTGVGADREARLAKQHGVPFLITDHHALPETLPDAPAVVNPQRLAPGHPLRDLPGVGVAYKLIQEVYRLANWQGDEIRFLDLVALGIVADVATQQHDTRYLLQLGIERLRYPKRIGLQELMKAAQVDPSNLSADTIGFQVGPRLNALGRLDDASLAVTLLTTDSVEQARQIASQLESLNNERKNLENLIYEAALSQLVREPSLMDYESIVLNGPRWHPGVIGIVASRLVERYGKPAVLLTDWGNSPGIVRGSARSVPGVDIGRAFAANAELLKSHGGHPGAAGCSLEEDLVPQFRRRLSETIAAIRDDSIPAGRVVDAEVAFGEVTMKLADELNRLAPFGAGNPPVHLLTTDLVIESHALMGIGKKHRRILLKDASGVEQTVIWWRGSESLLPRGPIDLLYIPRMNDYKGSRALQLEWLDWRPAASAVSVAAPEVRVIDLRDVPDPLSALPDPPYGVWVEGLPENALPFEPEMLVSRFKPGQHEYLVLWTIPPGTAEFNEMLALTGAHTFYVVAHNRPAAFADFIAQLAARIKYACIAYPEGFPFLQLASAMGQREVTLRYGLDWLAEKGEVGVEWLDGDRLQFMVGDVPTDPETIRQLESSIGALLAETNAFRVYVQKTDSLEALFRETGL
nr:single-stranded-DNA-specific exonuclease RecJ [Anaerolineae bacterium]